MLLEKLLKEFNFSINTFNLEESKLFDRYFERILIGKDTFLIKEGEIERYSYFVYDGMLRCWLLNHKGGECCQLCIYCDEEMEKEVMAQLPGLSVSRWNPFFADVNVTGVNKAMGINEFASYYGFDVSGTIAFGDGGNDISMIRAAGMGIAMGGASEAVKSVADYITETVDEHGIRNALVHFGIVE